MATYQFRIRKHVRDDMYKSESVEVELTDNEARSINNDDSKYLKCSALVSSKLGYNVEAQGFPTKVEKQKSIEKKSAKKEENKTSKKKSFFKPLWAIPFKLVWWIIKLPFKLIFSIFRM